MELAAPTPPDAGAPPHAPGDFAGTEVPAAYDMRGGKAPSALPYAGALRPSTPGDFLPDEKVTKESPGAAPLGTRWCEVSALFALAYASRRAAFCHCRRWICHFEVVRAIGCAVALGFNEEEYSAVNPWRGSI